MATCGGAFGRITKSMSIFRTACLPYPQTPFHDHVLPMYESTLPWSVPLYIGRTSQLDYTGHWHSLNKQLRSRSLVHMKMTRPNQNHLHICCADYVLHCTLRIWVSIPACDADAVTCIRLHVCVSETCVMKIALSATELAAVHCRD